MAFKLMFTGKYSSSTGLKLLIIAGLLFATLSAGWIIFVDNETLQMQGDNTRKIILFSCALIYTFRMIVTLFIFMKRKILWWESVFGFVVIPLVLFYYVYTGSQKVEPINYMDTIGILLYLTGSFINTYSEAARYTWKKKPENNNRLFTEGLFSYSRHINYLGDILLFGGFAFITNEFYSFIVPMIMTFNFILFLIPAKENYLKEKYGGEFAEYSKHTKKLLPYIY